MRLGAKRRTSPGFVIADDVSEHNDKAFWFLASFARCLCLQSSQELDYNVVVLVPGITYIATSSTFVGVPLSPLATMYSYLEYSVTVQNSSDTAEDLSQFASATRYWSTT